MRRWKATQMYQQNSFEATHEFYLFIFSQHKIRHLKITFAELREKLQKEMPPYQHCFRSSHLLNAFFVHFYKARTKHKPHLSATTSPSPPNPTQPPGQEPLSPRRPKKSEGSTK